MVFCLKKNLNQYDVWQKLTQISFEETYQKKISFGPIQLEMLHHKVNENILEKIAQLADLQGFFTARDQWMRGEETCLPSFMHLRRFENSSINAKHQQEVFAMRQQMKIIAEKIRSNQWLGYSGKPVTDIVNIGIGGSDLGPKFYFDALKSMQKNAQLKCHFISDADYYLTKECLGCLNPETTLFIVSSKSFSTEETMMNVEIAKQWIDKPNAIENHFIAVTANSTRAKELGYVHIVAFGDWVVGRYSITSAINLINTIMFGFDNYLDFIQGAEEMDKHFLSAKWQDNLPIMLAFISIWNINFLKLPTQLMLVYHSKLRYLVDYVQQMDMESNGKSHNLEGRQLDYSTGPIIWGGLGNQSQHSYYQLLAQGSHQVAIDFLSVEDDKNYYLNQLCLKRKASLFYGVEAEHQSHSIKRQQSINHTQIKDLSPRSLGSLIAMYEHKVFTQAWLWHINPFDQPGVESAKLDSCHLLAQDWF
jgi:glucose-6-phosphate isomerase